MCVPQSLPVYIIYNVYAYVCPHAYIPVSQYQCTSINDIGNESIDFSKCLRATFLLDFLYYIYFRHQSSIYTTIQTLSFYISVTSIYSYYTGTQPTQQYKKLRARVVNK